MRHAQGEQQPCCLLPCVVYSSHLVAHMRKHNYSVGGTLSGGQVTGGRSPPAGVWGTLSGGQVIPRLLPSFSLAAAGGISWVTEELLHQEKLNMQCLSCGAEIQPGVRKCASCGTPRPPMPPMPPQASENIPYDSGVESIPYVGYNPLTAAPSASLASSPGTTTTASSSSSLSSEPGPSVVPQQQIVKEKRAGRPGILRSKAVLLIILAGLIVVGGGGITAYATFFHTL